MAGMASKKVPPALAANKFTKGSSKAKAQGAKGGRKSVPPTSARKGSSKRR